MGGLLATGASMVFTASDTQHATPAMEVGYLLSGRQKSLTPLMEATKANLVNYKNYIPAAAGAVVTAAPRIPIVKMVAKPMSDGIKAFTGRRWGL